MFESILLASHWLGARGFKGEWRPEGPRCIKTRGIEVNGMWMLLVQRGGLPTQLGRGGLTGLSARRQAIYTVDSDTGQVGLVPTRRSKVRAEMKMKGDRRTTDLKGKLGKDSPGQASFWHV